MSDSKPTFPIYIYISLILYTKCIGYITHLIILLTKKISIDNEIPNVFYMKLIINNK